MRGGASRHNRRMLKRRAVPERLIETPEELRRMWLALRDPWCEASSRLRFVVMNGNGMPRPFPVEIDVLAQPEPERLSMILDVLSDMLGHISPNGSLAVQYLSAQAIPTEDSVAQWVDLISAELRARNLDRWPVFVGNATEVWQAETQLA